MRAVRAAWAWLAVTLVLTHGPTVPTAATTSKRAARRVPCRGAGQDLPQHGSAPA